MARGHDMFAYCHMNSIRERMFHLFGPDQAKYTQELQLITARARIGHRDWVSHISGAFVIYGVYAVSMSFH